MEYNVMCPKDADRILNSVDPDQPAVWPESSLFAQTVCQKT